MATNYQALLDQFLAADPATNPDFNMAPVTQEQTLLQSKMEQVDSASKAKRQSMGQGTGGTNPDGYVLSSMRANGAGVASATERDRDFVAMTPNEFRGKYGDEAGVEYTAANSQGEATRRSDLQTQRSGAQMFGDTVNTIAAAPVQMIGGIGALAAGGVNDRAGVYAAEKLGDFTDWAQGLQSEAMQGARRDFGVRQQLSEQDNAAQEAEDTKKDGAFIAGAKKIGRDVIDSFGNLSGNSAMVSDTIANAGGSLIGGGTISSGLRAIGRSIVKTGAVSATGKIAALGSKASMPASIVGMEAGAAYQQTVDAAMQELAGRDDLTEEQKLQMANDAGLEAAAIQGSVTAITAPLLGGAAFERAPFRVGSVNQAIKRALGETVEEGFQEGSAQASQNKAIQDQVNPDQSLTEGVGSGIAMGAVGGLGSSTATQAPGVALRGALETAKLPVRALSKALTYAGDRVIARNQATQDALLGGGDQILTEEREPENSEVGVDPMSDVTPDDPDVVATAEMFSIPKARIARALSEPDFRAQVEVTKRMKVVADGNAPVEARLEAATDLNGLTDDAALAENLDTNEPLKGIKSTVSKAFDAPVVQKAISAAKTLYETHSPRINEQLNGLLDRLNKTPEAVDPIEIEQASQAVLTLSEYTPDQVDPVVVDKILYHADQGDIQLNPEQRVVLRSAVALAKATQVASDEALKFELPNASDVSRQILTERRKENEQASQKSLVEHMEGIRAAYNAGDRESAAQLLTKLSLFGQHMGNKVGALNAALVGGNTSSKNPVLYDSLSARTGRFVTGAGKLHLSPVNLNSVKIAQQIALETSTVVAVANNLIDAFPDLGIKHIVVPVLDSTLNGDAVAVTEQYRSTAANVPIDQGNVTDGGVIEADQVDQVETPSEIEEQENNTDQQISEDTETIVAEEPSEPEAQPVIDPIAEPVLEAVSEVEEQESVEAEIETEIKTSAVVLLGSDNNRVKLAFKEPTKKSTRTFGVESPMTTIKAALKNETSFREMIDGDLNRAYTVSVAKAYQELLQIGDSLMGIMDDRLKAFLNKPAVQKADLNAAVTWINGQALNIVDAETGAYDRVLLENATLAGLQWFLKLNQYGSQMDEKDARQLLRLPPETIIPEGLIDELNVGLGTAEIVRSLSREIGRFWGLDQDPNVPRNFAEGVKEGVAKELLQSMLAAGLIEETQVDISEVTTNEKITFVNRYTMAKTDSGQPIVDGEHPVREFPTAIEKAVLFDAEEVNYIGSPPTVVSKTQLRNQAVENTPEQIEAIKKQQAVPHYINVPFVDVLSTMGEDMAMRLFAAPVDGPLNINHKRTLDGRRLTVQSAFRTIQSLVRETSNYAVLNKVELGDAPIHFDYNDTVVNRQQMLGKDNPQSNKLMREAVLPTWKTLDLTDGSVRDQFFMGLAQALGIKVHTLDQSESLAQVRDKLAQFPNTLALLNDQSDLRFTEEAIDSMKSEGVNSVVGLHALMEYNRYLNEATDKSQFRTSIYFEADGVTNGVVNAMALFSSGDFTGTQLEALARGGYNVGEDALSLAQIRKRFPKAAADLYGLAGTYTTQNVARLRSEYAADAGVTNQFNAVRDLMLEFFPGVTVDNQGYLIVDRGAVKNPLTITIYGSGARGISGNIVSEIVGNIYERMSLAAQRMAEDKSLTEAQAIYGGTKEEAQAKFDRLLGNLNTLMAKELVSNKDGLYVDEKTKARAESFKDPKTFSFPPAAIRSLQVNMLHAFVNPMVDGITETVGEDVMQSVDIVKVQTQSWSLLGKYAYQQAYNEAIQKKRAANPKMSKNELLSQKEEDAILKSVWDQLPYFSTGQQNFLFGMKQSNDVRTEFARGFNDEMDTPAFGYTPEDSGVAGIPGLTIGSGDGQTIINAVLDPEMPNGFLQIFDGIHSSVADMGVMGQVANRAVFGAWQKNPLASLNEAFSKFVAQADLSNLNDDQRQALTKSLFPADKWRQKMTNEQIMDQLKVWASKGAIAAQGIAERHAVMARVQGSVDQMAGAANPYQVTGLILSGSPEQKAAAMQQLRNKPTKIKAAPESDRAAEAVPVRIVTPALMGKMLDKQINKLTPDRLTRALVRDLVRSGRVDDYSIFTGSREQLMAKAADLAISVRGTEWMGFTVPGSKAIFVVDSNPETMLHEMIHAATFETIDAHYRGEDVGTAAQLAISNLEELMNQFKETDLGLASQQNALDEMERQEAAQSRAGELNEFMAWSLSNADLQDALKASKANAAILMARKVISALKALLWGSKRSAAVKDDMFSNIRFNTMVVARSQQSVAQIASEGVLYHDPNYGNDDRITALMERMKNKITDYAGSDPIQRSINREKMNPALANASRVALAFQNAGFNMTKQQQMAFIRMIAIMGTNADLDPNATVRMQELFTHTANNLSVNDFLRNPEENDSADTEQATLKLNVLLGKFANRKDAYDRSVVLPAFMALASVDNGFRQILSKMPMPKTKYAQWNTVDNILDNIGDSAIDNLGRWVSGQGITTPDVQTALDGLMDTMMETAQESQLYIEKFTSPIGDGIDKANSIVMDAMDYVGRVSASVADNVTAKNPNAKIKIAVAESLRSVTGLLNEQNGHAAAVGLMSAANRTKLWRPFYELLKDMIGRTSENAQVYDLIKIARTWVNGMRQQFREQLPRILNSKFSRELTDLEQTHLYQGLGQTGLASLLSDRSVEQVLTLLTDSAARDVEVARLNGQIETLSPRNAKKIKTKVQDLARYMIRKDAAPNLLRNAEAIAHLFNEGVPTSSVVTTPEMIKAIDALVTLQAVELLPEKTNVSLASLVQSEAEGLGFMLSYLQGQDELENAKKTGNARFNHWKGHIPSVAAQGVSLMVASDKKAAALLERSYTRLNAYAGSTKDPSAARLAYYYAPVSGRAQFAQGIMQNVQQTVAGVDISTGFSTDLTAGVITEPALVDRISKDRTKEAGSALLPVFDENGNIYAYERSIDPVYLSRLQQDTNMSKMMGVRSGRISEEASANEINKALIDKLREMYDTDKKAGRINEYVNLSKSKDPVHQDAVKIFSNETRSYISARFPEGFYVRKDMIDDAVGYRSASVGDAWSGNSRWSPATQEHVKKMLMGMFGNKAFAYANKAETLLQNVVQDIKVAIVIKSIVVPMANAAANIYQLIARGVPIVNILREIPKKTAEIESWHKSRVREIEAQAELLAVGDDDPIQQRRLQAEIQTIQDSHKRLSIWPLLQAGEFSSISDAGNRDDIMLTEGKLSEFLEASVNKLPPSVRTAGKYAIISKDTALFRALQKSVEYGDFVAKAILYEDLTKRQKKDKAYALGRVTEEFVNYDRLPGRDRAYIESIGLLWFWNFKIRTSKIALSMLRNNPVHALIAGNIPIPLNGIGLPIEDNFWTALFEGRLSGSIGFGMSTRAPGLLPIGNLLW